MHQGWQRTSQVTSSLLFTMGIFHTLAGEINKQKCIYKYLSVKWMRNLTNLALSLVPCPKPEEPTEHQGFARTAHQCWAGEVSTRAFTPAEQCGSARLSCTDTIASTPVTSSWLGNGGHKLLLTHVNHLKRPMFHSWHLRHHLGSPRSSSCDQDPPHKGAVTNLSEKTVLCTQQNTVN